MNLRNSIILLMSLLLASCGGNTSKKTSAGFIKIDGSSTVYPVTEAVAEEYRVSNPNVKITIGISGTGGGFNKFGRGETDISDASRPIKQSEIDLCEENNIDYLGLKVGFDGLAVLINPENDWVDHFTVEELKKIWEPDAQGNIMRWNQVREEWPDEEMHLYGPGIASGTYDYFTESVVGKSGSSRGDFTASEDDNVLVQGIAGDKYGLGFFGLAYYKENKDKLSLVTIFNGSEFVAPSIETVMNGTYTPLSRPLFIYVNSKAIERPEVVDFVKFYLSNAGSLAEEVGYVPMPEAAYEEELKKFQDFIQ